MADKIDYQDQKFVQIIQFPKAKLLMIENITFSKIFAIALLGHELNFSVREHREFELISSFEVVYQSNVRVTKKIELSSHRGMCSTIWRLRANLIKGPYILNTPPPPTFLFLSCSQKNRFHVLTLRYFTFLI